MDKQDSIANHSYQTNKHFAFIGQGNEHVRTSTPIGNLGRYAICGFTAQISTSRTSVSEASEIQ